jgi:hypothetical protein
MSTKIECEVQARKLMCIPFSLLSSLKREEKLAPPLLNDKFRKL